MRKLVVSAVVVAVLLGGAWWWIARQQCIETMTAAVRAAALAAQAVEYEYSVRGGCEDMRAAGFDEWNRRRIDAEIALARGTQSLGPLHGAVKEARQFMSSSTKLIHNRQLRCLDLQLTLLEAEARDR